MTFSEKIETIHEKTEQNKNEYDLDWQTTEFLALSSGNVDKYKFLRS